jgi:hypothetical protein
VTIEDAEELMVTISQIIQPTINEANVRSALKHIGLEVNRGIIQVIPGCR